MFDLRRVALVFVLCSAVLVLGFTASPCAAQDPRVGPNVQVNAPQEPFPMNFPGRSSPSLAISKNGSDMLIGFDDLQGLCGPPIKAGCTAENPSGVASFAFSTNGGRSWTDGGPIAPMENQGTAGHTWVDVMPAGGPNHPGTTETFFLVSRLWDSTTGVPLGVGVYRGHFAGRSFTWDDATALQPPSSTAGFTRESIATAKDGSRSAYVVETDSVGVCGTPFAGAGQIELWRTHDGGATWQGPAIVSPESSVIQNPNNPNCGSSGPLQVAATVVVGPHGEVYVAWQRGPTIRLDGTVSTNAEIWFASSVDGGRTFDTPHSAAAINSNFLNPPVAYFKNRLNDQARLAVVPSGRHFGRIYLGFYQPVVPVQTAVTAQSLVSTESFLIHSDDGGTSWSFPQPIGPSVPATGLKRFWPTIAVGPGDEVDVAYLESQEVQLNPNPDIVECKAGIGPNLYRTGPAVSLIDTYMVQSHDGAASFGPPVRISSETTNWCNVAGLFGGPLLSNLGDYFAFKTFGSTILTAWPDGRNEFPDVFFAATKE